MTHYNDIFRLGNIQTSSSFNLHNHTTFSDGAHSVRQIIEEAKYKLITHLSITDHDTLDAYRKGNAMILAKGHGINMIPGVEATVLAPEIGKLQSHMLLYFNEKLLKDKQFLGDFDESIGSVRSRLLFEKRLEKINEIFLDIIGRELTIDGLIESAGDDFKSMNSKHIYDYILKVNPALAEINSGETQNLARQITGSKSPAYIPTGTSLSDIMYLKNRYDLVSVLAHPMIEAHSEEENKVMHDYIISLIKASALDGLERYHPKINRELENIIGKYVVALFTAGTDTHFNDGRIQSLENTGISNIENRDFERLKWKGDLGIMVGRMNPPHIGHIRVIKNALKENSRVILFSGSANVINDKNPFPHSDKELFLETYFVQEIKEGRLVINYLDDVNDDGVWVENLGVKIKEIIPGFNGKLNFYGGDFKEDKAILAIKEHQDRLGIENVNYEQIPRDHFNLLHNGEKHEVSATALRDALSKKDYTLARKFLSEEIADLVISKWKEKNNEFKDKKIFFVYPPEGNRNFNAGNEIKKKIDRAFAGKYAVENPEDADKIVVVGGDGSLIWAIKEYGHLDIPFYPIAAGTANAIPANFENPYQIFSEEIEEFEFKLLEAEIFDDNGKLIGNIEGFNDIYLKAKNGEMGHLMIEADHYEMRAIEGDGVTIATPLGSTAYNKNAGGSVVDLDNNGITITDLIGNTGVQSSVISNKSVINIYGIRGSFDIIGNNRIDKVENFSMTIKQSDKKVKVILPRKEEFRQNRYK